MAKTIITPQKKELTMPVECSFRRRKKWRMLGEVQVVRRETYAAMDLDTKVELIRSFVPLGLMARCQRVCSGFVAGLTVRSP